MRNIALKFWIGLILITLVVVFGCKEGKNPAGSGTPGFFFEYFQGSCKEGLVKLAKASGNGSIVLSSFNDTIRVLHTNVNYNCCAEITVGVVETEKGFNLFEKDEGEDCRCMCYIDVTTFIYDVSAGTYYIKVFDISGNLVDYGYVVVRPKDPSGYPG
jgi:hypothetical protein